MATNFQPCGIDALVAAAVLALSGCGEANTTPSTVAESNETGSMSLAPESKQIPVAAVEVIRVRVSPFESAAGLQLKVVLVDWKNVGEVPIRAVDANIILFDERSRLDGGAKDYAIYAVSDDSPGVVPGEVYREPLDRGHILDRELATRAIRARVEITEVLESGAY